MAARGDRVRVVRNTRGDDTQRTRHESLDTPNSCRIKVMNLQFYIPRKGRSGHCEETLYYMGRIIILPLFCE